MTGAPKHPHLVVTGAMGVGKTTTAAALAHRLGLPLRDSDADIERLTGHTGAELTERVGVDELHRLESAVLLGALADRRPAVIAAAGWVVEDPRCREALARRATVVVLEAPLDVILARISTDDGEGIHHRRHIDREAFETLLARRAPLVDEVADLRIEVVGTPDELVADLAERLEQLGGPGPDGSGQDRPQTSA